MWLVLGVRQSSMQMVALMLLLSAAVLLSTAQPPTDGLLDADEPGEMASRAAVAAVSSDAWTTGVIAVLAASALSGLGSTLSQRATAVYGRLVPLLNLEMALTSSLILAASLAFSPDGRRVMGEGFFSGWESTTMVPVVCHAVGGLLVAQVTSSLGGVAKGFAIVAGLVITGITQAALASRLPQREVLAALLLVVVSVALHTSYPPKKPPVRGIAAVSPAQAKKAEKAE